MPQKTTSQTLGTDYEAMQYAPEWAKYAEVGSMIAQTLGNIFQGIKQKKIDKFDALVELGMPIEQILGNEVGRQGYEAKYGIQTTQQRQFPAGKALSPSETTQLSKVLGLPKEQPLPPELIAQPPIASAVGLEQVPGAGTYTAPQLKGLYGQQGLAGLALDKPVKDPNLIEMTDARILMFPDVPEIQALLGTWMTTAEYGGYTDLQQSREKLKYSEKEAIKRYAQMRPDQLNITIDNLQKRLSGLDKQLTVTAQILMDPVTYNSLSLQRNSIQIDLDAALAQQFKSVGGKPSGATKPTPSTPAGTEPTLPTPAGVKPFEKGNYYKNPEDGKTYKYLGIKPEYPGDISNWELAPL